MARVRRTPPKPTSPSDESQRRLAIFSVSRTGKIDRAVVRALSDAGRLGRSVKEIARLAGFPLRTTYRAIHRLDGARIVSKVGQNYALTDVLADVTSDPTAILGFENFRFEVSNWQTTPTPPIATAIRWTLVSDGSTGTREVGEASWEGRRIVLTHRRDAKALDVIVSAKGSPIPLLAAPVLQGWLQGMLGLGRGETVRTTYIEVNAGHESFVLMPTYLELRHAGEFAQVLYQKSWGLKHELRLYRPVDGDGTSLSLDRAIEILVEGSPVRQLLKVAEIELETQRLRVQALQIESERTARERQAGETPPTLRKPETIRPDDAVREGFG